MSRPPLLTRRGIAPLLLLLLLPACRQQMAEQPRYDPLEESSFFPDHRAARPLPIGPQRTAEINDAIAQFRRALAIDPDAPHAKNNIALAQQWLSARETPPRSPGSPAAPPRR